MKTLLEKVKSSNLDAIGFDKEIDTLYVKFLGGGLYSYYPVKVSTFNRFKKAKSKGEFFHKHIKDNAAYKVNKILDSK